TFTPAGALTIASNLTVNGTILNIGNGSAATIQTPSGNANLTLKTNGSGILTLDTGSAAAVNIGATANALTFEATNNPSYTFNGTGAFTVAGGGANNITLGSSTGNGNVVIQPNAGGQAALIINKQGNNDI